MIMEVEQLAQCVLRIAYQSKHLDPSLLKLRLRIKVLGICRKI